MISIIIPVYNSAAMLRRSLDALAHSRYPSHELIVVDDGSADGSAEVARAAGARVVTVEGGPRGPAHARNRGAAVARGEVLFFVDADVLVRPDTLEQVALQFEREPGISALFGSYDERPDIPDFTSQYKNLFHSFVHQNARREASTFWSGCGAIRRDVFLAAGGFDEQRYARPSIEDIELGTHLVAAGHRILLVPELQVTHLKRWTLPGLLHTDIFARGIPWTRLTLRAGGLPDDLNLRLSQRVSGGLVGLLLALHLLAAPFTSSALLLLLVMLYLILIGYWPASATARDPRGAPVALVLALALAAALVAGAVWGGYGVTLLPLLPAALGLSVARPLAARNAGLRAGLFAALVVGFLASYGLLLTLLPTWMPLATLLLVGTVVTLNLDFYRFFADRRGLLFALAVLPFHLLYYLYSTVAFGIGLAAHLWTRGARRDPATY